MTPKIMLMKESTEGIAEGEESMVSNEELRL